MYAYSFHVRAAVVEIYAEIRGATTRVAEFSGKT